MCHVAVMLQTANANDTWNFKHSFLDSGRTLNENGKLNYAHVRQTSHAAV